MLLEFVSVRKIFQDNSGKFAVLKDINFKLKAGETLALTGESGSGEKYFAAYRGWVRGCEQWPC